MCAHFRATTPEATLAPPVPTPPAAPGSNPLAAFSRRTNTLAHKVSDFVAGKALAAGYPGVADWAQRHVMPTFFGCCGLVLTLTLGLAAAGYGALTSDAPAAPIVAQASVTMAPVDPMALAPGETLYKVVANDALSVIAVKNDVTVEALRARNPGVLAKWNADCLLKAKANRGACTDVVIKGKTLVIPAGGEQATSSAQ